MKCRKCGNELKDRDLFCGKCGNRIILKKENGSDNNKKKKKNKIILIIITISILIFGITISMLCFKNNNVENEVIAIIKNLNDGTGNYGDWNNELRIVKVLEVKKIDYNLLKKEEKENINKNTSAYMMNLKENTYGEIKIVVIDGIVTANSILGEKYEEMWNSNIFTKDKINIEQINKAINGSESTSNINQIDKNYSLYQEYLATIQSYQEKNKEENGAITSYALTDINKDGIQELIILHGTSNADYEYVFYTYQNNQIIKLGATSGNSDLYEMYQDKYLKQVRVSMGHETVSNIKIENNKIIVKEISSRELGVNELYEEGDEFIQFHKSNSLENLNTLIN